MTKAIIGIGGNLPSVYGDAAVTVSRAAHILELRFAGSICSSLYTTSPVGGGDQPEYINAAILIDSELGPNALLEQLKILELGLGREKGDRWGARVIDLDLLLYGDLVIPDAKVWRQIAKDPMDDAITEELVLPHPRMHARAFACVPAAELWPEWQHPVLGESLAEIADADFEGQKLSRFEPK